MSSHIAHAAARGERIPLLPSRLLKALFPMEGTVNATHAFAIFLYHFSRVQLGIHHNRVQRSVSGQGLDHVHWSVAVEMFGSEDAAAVVRDDDKRRTVRSPQSTFDGHCLDAAPDCLDPKGARVPYALQQIRRTRARLSLPMVPVITRRYRLSSVKAFDVANGFGEHTSETIPDGHDTGTVIFGRLHVKHIIEPPVRHAVFEDAERSEFAGFLDSQTTLYQDL